MKNIAIKLSAVVLLLCNMLFANAQESDNIVLSAYVSPTCGVPQNSYTVLNSKLSQLITRNGFAEIQNQRFILTAKVDVITEDITDTAPAMFAYTLNFNLYIGDGVTGQLFSSTAVEAKGVGLTKDKAYMNALRSLNVRHPAFREFINEGKDKIVEYYTRNCDKIIQKAQVLAASQEYEQAMYELSLIPNVCSDCYNKASNMIMSIYKSKTDEEGEILLAQARAAWNAGQDWDAAQEACSILAQINPVSAAFTKAQALEKQIAARVQALDKREWNFMLQKQADETAIRKAQIKSARDISVAWATHQPKTIYNIRWW